MKKEDIASEIARYIEAEFPSPGAVLADDTDLLNDWFVDSLAVVDTVMFLETRFGIGIERADINEENFRNVASLAEFVDRRLAG